jgi:hypothetical protein
MVHSLPVYCSISARDSAFAPTAQQSETARQLTPNNPFGPV